MISHLWGCISTKVGEKTYEDHLRHQLVPYKDEDSASTIKIDSSCKKAVEAKSALEAFGEESKKFETPFNYEVELMQRLHTLKDAWEKAHSGLENCADNIHRLAFDAKGAKASQKKKWHEQKQKVVNFIRGGGTGLVPLLSSIFGEMAYERASDPTKVGIPITWECPKFDMQDGDTKATLFKEPFVWRARPNGETGAVDPFFDAIASVMTNLKDEYTKRIASLKKDLAVKTCKHGAFMGLVPYTSGNAFQYNGIGDKKVDWFTDVVDTGCEVVITKRCLFLELSGLGNALRGHSMYLKSLTSTLAVFIVSAEQFGEHHDIKSWLSTCDAKEVEGNYATLLDKDDIMYVPMGWIPIWMSLPTDVDMFQPTPKLAARGRTAQKAAADKKKELYEESHSVAITLIYNKGDLPNVSNAVRSAVAAANLLSSAIYPAKLGRVAGVKEHFSAVTPPASGGDGDGLLCLGPCLGQRLTSLSLFECASAGVIGVMPTPTEHLASASVD